MTKKPSYRFVGYTEVWEEKKLGETETLFTDGNYGEAYPSEKDLTTSENGVPFLRGSNLVNGVLDENNANYITHEKHEELTSGHIELDDIILAVRGSLGAIGYAKDENVGWNINSQLAIIRTNKNEAKGDFLLQFFISTKGQRELLSRNTGTALKQLPLKQLKDIPVPLPSLPEQTAIGSFFQDIDQLISLQQHKLEVLKEQKKTYLKLLFPAKGQTKPALRFAGFEDDWKEVKLGEVGVTKSGVGFPDSEQGGVRGIPFYKVSDMNNIGNEIEMVTSNNYVTQEQIDSRKWKVIDTVPAIMFAKVGAALLLNRKRLIREPFLIDNNTMVYIPSAYWEVMFCKILFDTLNLSKYSQVGALPSYNGSDIEAIQVLIPTLPEQEAIGSFFQDLDKAIAKQEEKVNQLKESKQTLLRKMFI